MKLDRFTVESLAAHLESCELQARETSKLTDEHPHMDLEDAYAIQDAILHRKMSRGLGQVGFKAGLTSHAKMKQMGVASPVYGFLTSDHALLDGGECNTAELIHPKVEPELAFVVKRPLRGPGCHIGTVLAALDFVMPSIEVIDSRYRDFKFDVSSVVADNTSAARFVTGSRVMRGDAADLPTIGAVLEKNGVPVTFGAGAAVLGHPAAVIAMLANHLGARGQEVPAGTLILSGGLTEAVSVQRGDCVTLRVQGMGSTSLRFA